MKQCGIRRVFIEATPAVSIVEEPGCLAQFSRRAGCLPFAAVEEAARDFMALTQMGEDAVHGLFLASGMEVAVEDLEKVHGLLFSVLR